ncbi:MAG: Ldh family oxidoreductase [Candidatus Latescibacteria bacterium]|jgi:hydroxycarboxylate dehydrogenase B|nr:Ldh family oxidoreductase [Candidatus Latescibacterota bacterium]
MPTFKPDELCRIGREIYEQIGASPEEAETVANLLVDANLAGHDSHGVVRIPQYVSAIKRGQIKLGTSPEIEKETAATAIVNGHWGFGHVTAKAAMEVAIEKARETAVGIVTVHQCNHIGRLGAYTPLAVDAGMAGLITNNGHGADRSMAPFGGLGRILPASCMAVAFPSDRDFPVALDLTAAAAAGGKMRVALARGEKVPEGWLMTADGQPTNEPGDYVNGSASLVPFGGHKGYGLGIVFDILSGAFSPAGCTREKSPVTGNALFIQAIRIDAFVAMDEFTSEVGRFIDYVKASDNAPGFDEILMPGERSWRNQVDREANGIVIEDKTWTEICDVAQELNVKV